MIALQRGPVVFAVEDRSAQLTWRVLPVGPVRLECDDCVVEFVSDGGPGTADVVGLRPDAAHVVRVVSTGGTTVLRFRTLPAPPGEELFRFATMSDLHLGRLVFGVRNTLTDPPGVVEHPVRCARSALDDLTAWGAQRLVIKGDFVDHSSERSWALAREFVDSAKVPVDIVPGNHDVAHGDSGALATAQRHGVEVVRDVETRDVPGLRLVLMNSAVEDVDIGCWAHLQDAATEAVAGTTGPAMLLVHHHPQAAPVPTHFPPGIDSITARRFLRSLAGANGRLIGSSGHTHRSRRRNHLGITWSEVGSPKDYPGVWAGYAVHEGGIRQVVRRVSAPDCLEWLDRTRFAAGGLWGLWSPGRLHDRCFTHRWDEGR